MAIAEAVSAGSVAKGHPRPLAQATAIVAVGRAGVGDLVGTILPNAVLPSARSSRHDLAVDPAAR